MREASPAVLRAWVETVHQHAASALALELSALEPGHLRISVAALVGDAVLLPFELRALLQHPSVVRGLVLGSHLLIVAWLVRHAVRELRSRPTARP